MTTDLAIRDTSLPEKIEFARFLAKADLLPKAYQDKPANLLYAIEYGAMLGLPPIAAVVGIHVIDGRPTMSAGLMAAKVREAGHKIRVESKGDGDQAMARCTIVRKDDPGFTYAAVWTMERAKTAGLLSKTNWRQHPIQMLKNRAVSECCRDACQEVLLGIHYTPDELGGDDDGGEVISDGYPTLPNGQLDASHMSEQEKDDAGLMTREQRVQHAELRRGTEDPPGTERLTEPDDSDPWQNPAPPKAKSPPAPESWRKNLVKLLDKFPVGKPEDLAVLLEWITGRQLPAGIDDTITRSEVKLIADMLNSHLETAEGDYETAASKLWEQYRKQHPEEGDAVPGD